MRQLTFWTVLLGLVGLGLWMLLAWKRRSLEDAARTGPAWKRRLLRATLMLLTLFGIATTQTGCTCYVMPPFEVYAEKEVAVDLLARHTREINLLEQAQADSSVLPEVIDRRASEIHYSLLNLGANKNLTRSQRESTEVLAQRAEDLIRSPEAIFPDDYSELALLEAASAEQTLPQAEIDARAFTLYQTFSEIQLNAVELPYYYRWPVAHELSIRSVEVMSDEAIADRFDH